MGLDSLAKLGEFIGGVFVVITLVYLAYHVRQNTKSLRIENYARVLERMSTVQSRAAADPALNHVFTVGAEDPARLTRAERTRFSWALYEEDAMDPATIERWQRFVAGHVSSLPPGRPPMAA